MDSNELERENAPGWFIALFLLGLVAAFFWSANEYAKQKARRQSQSDSWEAIQRVRIWQLEEKCGRE